MKKLPNLLIVASGLYIGGAEKVAANLCRKIDRRKFNVTVCHLSESGPIGNMLYEEGYDIRPVSTKSARKIDYMTSLKLRKFVAENNIDIVHSHDMHSFIDCAILKVLRPRVKFLHTFHFGNYPHQYIKYKRIERLLWRLADKLIAVGYDQKARIQKTYNIPDSRITVITNGVDPPEHSNNTSLLTGPEYSGKVVVGTIATLIEQKGISDLVDVACILRKKIDNFVFVIVGDGHLREKLEEKINRLDLAKYVKFLGWVDNAAHNALPAFDIFFQPSLWEAMSMVILEAMMAGKPIVATRVGDNGIMIEDGITGSIVEPADVEAMSLSLANLIANATLRKEMGERGRLRAMTNYTAEIMARNHELLYIDVLDM